MTQIYRRIIYPLAQESSLKNLLNAFIRDRKASNLSPRSLIFYREKIDKFIGYCASNQVENVSKVTPDLLRSYTSSKGM